jgi:hypothetical protein
MREWMENDMSVDTMMVAIRALPVDERKRLISLIVDTLTEPEHTPAPRMHSILEFEGVGADIWGGVDVSTYLNELRDEWDEQA